MGRGRGRTRKEEAEEQESEGTGETTKYLLMIIFMAVASGPLLCATIHQVCVSKCLLLRRLPELSTNLDDLLLIVLFVFYVLLNFITCCVIWMFMRKGAKFLFRNWQRSRGAVSRGITLMDPKVTRSGRPYGYRRARYVKSDILARARLR